MKFVLNDACFDDDLVVSDCENRIRNLLSILKIAEQQSYIVYKHISNIQNWLKTHDDDELIDSKLGHQLRLYLQKIKPTPKLDKPNTHFFFFNHQDSSENLIHSTTDRVTDTALAFAAEQIQQAQSLSVINITQNEKFGNRPFLPILLSPHQISKPDVLVNIPCFHAITAIQNIENYLLFQTYIKPFLNEDAITIEKAFLDFKTQHDSSEWRPKQMDNKNEKLLPEHAFPATNNPGLKAVLEKFKEELSAKTKGSYEDNKAVYTDYAYAAAVLNGYVFNEKLSSHYKKYDIFEGGYGNKKLFLSADIENGCFEVIEFDGTHIGVYSYDGTCIATQYKDKTKLNDHSLKQIPQPLFLFP